MTPLETLRDKISMVLCRHHIQPHDTESLLVNELVYVVLDEQQRLLDELKKGLLDELKKELA